MAWQSRAVVNSVLRLGRQSTFSPSSFDTACKMSLSSSQILARKGHNSTNFQQVRYNSVVHAKLTAFNEVILGNVPKLEVALDVSELYPVLKIQEALCCLHDMTGFGWTGTIVLSAIGIRLFVGLPISILQQQALERQENLQPELSKLAETCRKQVSIEKNIYSISGREAEKKFQRAFRPQEKAMMIENNCTWLKILALGSLQIPFWLLISGALRNMLCLLPFTTAEAMAEQQYRFVEMMTDNPALFDCLVTPDAFALPAIFILTNLMNIELRNAERNACSQRITSFDTSVVWMLRSLTVGLGVAEMYCPSALSLYWATSSASSLVVNILLQVPAVRSFFRIPKTPSFEALTSKRKDFLVRLLRRKPSGPAT